MIGKLTGKISEIFINSIIIDVHGVGYYVYIGKNGSLILGEERSFHIFTNVKEDEISLYGFATYQEKEYFEILRSVQGVGNKLAMSIIGDMEIPELYHSIRNSEHSRFYKIVGVGKKIAQRIINELKEKDLPLPICSYQDNTPKFVNLGIRQEVSTALISLGFGKNEVESVLNNVLKDLDISEAKIEKVLEMCLKKIRG
ncbi:Holliday junction ATP-dependent DNA helicase RuvA [Candidatus Cyrtobacter comes]|uniref:Holliday junction branch migration complex subunit RuvA n=1 Tax=Candidatus Cyrtobacter comes TaxID=675776 RepID=A0ABU5L7H4_9RICK|nr:Holliday junction branch migration protein RuvA [Candidatus Cyrtobacter comes]MDZ5762078.1 Holliday junction ATP-dependent DNA helicase RuvA [Candidatus Cyrtobacter comes]